MIKTIFNKVFGDVLLSVFVQTDYIGFSNVTYSETFKVLTIGILIVVFRVRH